MTEPTQSTEPGAAPQPASSPGPRAGEPAHSDPVQQGGLYGNGVDRLKQQEALIEAQHAAQRDAKREALEDTVRLLVEARRMIFHIAPCRETSMISTRIEEAMLWAHAAMISSPAVSFGFVITAENFSVENFLAGSDDGKT